MDELKNPFAPGAGIQPPKLAGRDETLRRTGVALGRTIGGRFAKGLIIFGLRGVGKTVLLNRAFKSAHGLGYWVADIEAAQGQSLPELLVPQFRSLLLRLARRKEMGAKAHRALKVLAAFARASKARFPETEAQLSIEPEAGVADSGDIVADLTDLLEAVGEAAREQDAAFAIIADEMQDLSKDDMASLIMALHRMAQHNLPVALIGGGLPQVVGLAGRAKSYSERLFDFPDIGELNQEETIQALTEPIEQAGAKMGPKAARKIFEHTRGYPYFVQTWGYHTWNVAKKDEITVGDVEKATGPCVENLNESFFRVRFGRLTTREILYLEAMAELGEGPHRSGEIASRLGMKVEKAAPIRDVLITKGMIHSPARGDTAFTVPKFDNFIKRIQAKSAANG